MCFLLTLFRHLPRALQLANLVADERHKLYLDFVAPTDNRLRQYLDLVADAALVQMDNGGGGPFA